jgi:hypothetical protein
MNGRITKLVDGEQTGIITRDDGIEYKFTDSALAGTTFNALSLGEPVQFIPTEGGVRHASIVRLQSDRYRL